MDILSFKPGHDGTVALVKDSALQFSFEAEKDSFPRYSDVTTNVFLDSLSYTNTIPDVVAVSGYVKYINSITLPLEAGYFGIEPNKIITRKEVFLGKKVDFFSSSHERSHILCTYSMSDIPQGQPCYALVWEGFIGSFYEIDEKLNINNLG